MGRGFLNARDAGGREQGEDLVPGRPYRATVRFLGSRARASEPPASNGGGRRI
jgi:hypothetical protein